MEPRWIFALSLVTAFALATGCSFDDSSLDIDATAADSTTGETDTDDGTDTGEEQDTDDGTDTGEGQDTDVDTTPPPLPATCTTDADCNDGLACTTDRCDEERGHCVWEVQEGSCMIGRECWTPGQSDPRGPCLSCNPEVSQTEWTARAEGDYCDLGSMCFGDGVCTGGTCVAEPVLCDDGNACTTNRCDDELGCVFEPVFDGTSCDDGNACTLADSCQEGRCVGTPRDCNDGNVCTTDRCDQELGCVYEFNTAPCDDGNACTVGDACSDGFCMGGGPRNCDDGNACTVDSCVAGTGCVHIPTLNPCCVGSVSICDDGNPCTTDLCNPEDGSCRYEFNAATCDDGNACTSGDICAGGSCGGDSVDCEGDNECRAYFCDPETGCDSDPLTGTPCDTGISCTFDDVCQAGVCVAGRNECICVPEVWGQQAIKVTSMLIGDGGHPGQALDLDGNPATCAPTTNCSGGRHNALAAIGPFANDSLVKELGRGGLMLLLEIDDINRNPLQIAVHQGSLSGSNPDCDYQEAVCDYEVGQSGLDRNTCERVITLSATRAGSTIRAGGRGTVFPFEIPLGDSVLTITLYDVILEGQVTLSGGKVTSFTGILGGAVPRTQLIDAISALDPESLPMPPAQLINLLNVLVKDDIDTNSDGVADAASIGIPLVGIGANIVGLR